MADDIDAAIEALNKRLGPPTLSIEVRPPNTNPNVSDQGIYGGVGDQPLPDGAVAGTPDANQISGATQPAITPDTSASPSPTTTPGAEDQGTGQTPGALTASGPAPAPRVAPSPTAGDDINAAILRLQAQTQQTDQTGQQPPVLVNQPERFNAAQNYLAGVNGAIATALAMPADLVNNNVIQPLATRFLGAKDMSPDKFGTALKAAFNRVGIATEPAQGSIAGEIGQQTVPALATLGGLLAIAPQMIAANGLSKIIGEALTKYPHIAVLQEVAGATPGGVIGQRWSEAKYNNPYGSIPGALVGGMLAGGVTGVVKAGAQAVTAAGKHGIMGVAKTVQGLAETAVAHPLPALRARHAQLSQELNMTPKPFPNRAPVYDESHDPAYARIYGQHMIAGEQLRVENEILKQINRIPASHGDIRRHQVAAFRLLGEAERVGKDIESAFWKRTHLEAHITGDYIPRALRIMERQLGKRLDFSTPRQFMDALDDLVNPRLVADPKNPGFFKEDPKWKPPTIQKLRDLKAAIYRARKDELGKTMSGRTPDMTLVSNYNNLESMINTGIRKEFPGSLELQQAADFSTKMHDLFDRSDLFDILAKNSRGDTKIYPEKTVDELLKRYQGLEDMLQMTQTLSTQRRVPGQKMSYGTAANPQQQQVFKDLVATVKTSIQAEFRAAAEKASNDPKVVTKMLSELIPKVKPLADLLAEFQQVAGNLKGLMAERDLIESSALNRFVQKGSVEDAIKSVFVGNSEATAKGLIASFEHNHDALEGFRTGIIDEMFRRTAGDPRKMYNLITDPKMNRTFAAIFEKTDLARMERIATTAMRVQSGSIRTGRTKALPLVTIVARTFGAHTGSFISHHFLGGGGSIQVPAIFSNAAKNRMTKLLGADNPTDMMKKAFKDPEWERILYEKEPSTLADVARDLAIVKRITRSLEGARLSGQSMINQNRNQDDNQ